MTIRPKPRLVAKTPPAHRPVTLEQAARCYPDSADLQQKWLAAVEYLRTRSKCGWVMDRGSKAMYHAHETE